jgi:hypothetical protein
MFNQQHVSSFDKNVIYDDEKRKIQTFHLNQSASMMTDDSKTFNPITLPPPETVSYTSNLNLNYSNNNLLTSQDENVMLNTVYQKSASCVISTSTTSVKNINDENSDKISYNSFETNVNVAQSFENKCHTNLLEPLTQSLNNNQHLKSKVKKSSMILNIFKYIFRTGSYFYVITEIQLVTACFLQKFYYLMPFYTMKIP